MRYPTVVTAALSCGLFMIAVSFADAQPRRVSHVSNAANPLIIKKRSFLDSGTQVPVGSLNHYVTDTTSFSAPVVRATSQRDKFGEAALPQPLDVRGRPQPLFEFWTPRYPAAD